MTELPLPPPETGFRPHRDPEGERRHLTVMFCDLVRSTEIATRIDPEEYAEVLRAFQGSSATIIESFGGRIARFQGDGIMVYFGHPVAHDNDAARSIEAGLALVRSIDGLNQQLRRENRPGVGLRVGIHSGIAVVTDMGAGDRRELDDVVGELPAIAARLQGMGAPNQIVVSEATRRLTEDRFELSELGERTLPGVPTPVRLFAVTGENSDGSSRQRGKLEGRAREMSRLSRLLQEVTNGGSASAAIVGAPGLGKTRLVEELRATSAGAALQWLEVHCSEERRLTPLGAIIPALHSLLATQAGSLPEEEQIAMTLATTVESEGDRATFASLLTALLAPGNGAGASSERDASRRPEAVTAVVESCAGIRPTCLVLEDLQWADPTTVDTAARLLLSSQPGLMVIATARMAPTEEQWLPPSVPVIGLGRLSDEDVRALVEAVCPKDSLPADQLTELVRRADGIPLFARELALAAKEGATDSSARPSSTVPAPLLDSLTARLDRLGPAKHIAQVAAVIGRQFDRALLGELTPMEADALEDGLARLVTGGVLERVGGSDGGFLFTHELVREAAYESLLRSRRRRLHETIAAAAAAQPAAAPEWVARHYGLAGRPREAIRFRRRASSRALEFFAYREATGHLREALLLLDDLEPADRDRTEVELRLGLIPALMMTAGHGAREVGDNLARCLELADRDEVRPYDVISLVMSVVHAQARSNHPRAIYLSGHLVEMARVSGERSLSLAGHHLLGSSYFWAGDFERALDEFGLARRDFGQAGVEIRGFNQYGDVRVGLLSLEALALWATGRVRSAKQSSHEMFELLRELDHPYNEAMGQVTTALLHQWDDSPADALEAARRARELAAEHQYGFWHPWALALEGWALARLGSHDTGRAMIEDALRLMAATGVAQLRAYTLGLLADCLLETGRPAHALIALEEGLAESPVGATGFAHAGLRYLKARCLAAIPEREARARLAFGEAADAARAAGALNFEIRALRAMKDLGPENLDEDIARLVARSEEI